MTPATTRAVLNANSGMTMTGTINEFKGANIASAGTVNLDTATGNLVDITGTTTITGFTLGVGRERIVRFRDSLTLTHSASLLLPGQANIQTAENDFALIRGYVGAVAVAFYTRASGYLPIGTGPVTIAAGNISTVSDTSIALPAGTWSRLTLHLRNVKAASTFTPFLRVNADSGANYGYTQWFYNSSTSEGNGSRTTESGGSLIQRTTLIDLSTVTENPLDIELSIASPTAARHKRIFYRSTARASGGSEVSSDGAVTWRNTAAVVSLQLLLRDTIGTSPAGAVVNASAGNYLLVGELGTL